MKSILRYLGLMVLGVLVWGAADSQAETLQDAVHYMLQTNPEIRAVSWSISSTMKVYLKLLEKIHLKG